MFGIGLPEIAVILIVALIAFGPERLPDMARQAARILKTVRAVADQAKQDIAREMGEDFSGLNLRELDPRHNVKELIRDVTSDTRPQPATPPMVVAPPKNGAPYDAEAT